MHFNFHLVKSSLRKLTFKSNFAPFSSFQVKFEIGYQVNITYQSKDGLWGSSTKTGTFLSGA